MAGSVDERSCGGFGASLDFERRLEVASVEHKGTEPGPAQRADDEGHERRRPQRQVEDERRACQEVVGREAVEAARDVGRTHVGLHDPPHHGLFGVVARVVLRSQRGELAD
jgi:hypothetical protein